MLTEMRIENCTLTSLSQNGDVRHGVKFFIRKCLIAKIWVFLWVSLSFPFVLRYISIKFGCRFYSVYSMKIKNRLHLASVSSISILRPIMCVIYCFLLLLKFFGINAIGKEQYLHAWRCMYQYMFQCLSVCSSRINYELTYSCLHLPITRLDINF